MSIRPARSGAIAALAALSLTLAACGGKEEEAPPSTESAAAADAAQAIARVMEGVPGDLKLMTTASGLLYVDVLEGAGEPPRPGQQCVTHATGWLLDGTKFWSSLDPGPNGQIEPLVFPLGRGQAIGGWEEGLATMKPGGKRRLGIPPELGYGPQGRPPAIPPNATLIFDVELLEVRD